MNRKSSSRRPKAAQAKRAELLAAGHADAVPPKKITDDGHEDLVRLHVEELPVIFLTMIGTRVPPLPQAAP